MPARGVLSLGFSASSAPDSLLGSTPSSAACWAAAIMEGVGSHVGGGISLRSLSSSFSPPSLSPSSPGQRHRHTIHLVCVGFGGGERGGGRRGFSLKKIKNTFVNVPLIGALPTLTPPAEVRHLRALDAALRSKGNNMSNCQLLAILQTTLLFLLCKSSLFLCYLNNMSYDIVSSDF